MTGFQKLIGVSILILTLAFAYYLIIYIPGQANAKKELETQRQANLQVCLNNATTLEITSWNQLCAEQGSPPNCSLPLQTANASNKGFQDNKDSCYKQYPAP